jgi:hypothetical protein
MTIHRAPLIPAGVLALALAPAVPAAAQILPPVPPPAERTPPYEPPAPPAPPPVAPAPQQPPEPEPPLPSLVQRDEKGRVLMLDRNLEEAAILAFDLDQATRENVLKEIDAHHAELDARVLDNLPLVISTVKARDHIDTIEDLNRFFALATSLRPLRQASLLDRLVRSNAITVRQRTRAEQVMKEYTEAATRSTSDQAEGNVTQIIAVSARRSFLDASGDAARSFDRLVAAAAPAMDSLLEKVNLSAEQRAAVGARLEDAKRTGNPAARAAALRAICLDVLTPEQAAELLRSANSK